MLAIVAHDIGIIKGREGHADSSARLLATIALGNQLLFEEHETRILQAVIRCHSSSVNLESECSRFAEREVFAGHSVRPKFVAALVRLSDELDEDRRRAKAWVQDLANVPEASRPYWEFCQRIQGIDLGQPDGHITFHAVFRRSDAENIVHDNNRTISFLRFFANKMAKINRERQLTGRYLEGLARHELMVSVKPLEGVDKWKYPRVFVFSDGTLDPSDDNDVVDRFLRHFPELDSPPETPSPSEIPPELMRLAGEYEGVRAATRQENADKRNKVVREMVQIAVSEQVSRDLLAQSRRQGLIAALAGTIYSSPEEDDVDRLVTTSGIAKSHHLKYQIVLAFGTLIDKGLIRKDDYSHIDQILADFEREAGDNRGLAIRIQNTRAHIREARM